MKNMPSLGQAFKKACSKDLLYLTMIHSCLWQSLEDWKKNLDYHSPSSGWKPRVIPSKPFSQLNTGVEARVTKLLLAQNVLFRSPHCPDTWTIPNKWHGGFYMTSDIWGEEKVEKVYLFSFSTDKFPVHGKPSGYYFVHSVRMKTSFFTMKMLLFWYWPRNRCVLQLTPVL